uniref:Uncharacterized protein n=1 Tax=Euplotes crassus TaxID=5936 RepID=A0A7S3KIE7_EUPCR|mmetsp:Transcript_2596/g.2429  ORF Transcript_2596/g.2429 Transcript_2596/m.2429 type:complete len:512 (+) Transcript_2596:344-1879(+)
MSTRSGRTFRERPKIHQDTKKTNLEKINNQVELDPKDLPGYHDYKDNITHEDLDNLRDTVDRLKKSKTKMANEQKLEQERKKKDQKEFEKKIEGGKLTYDHTGKLLSIRKIKAERLPVDFKQLMSHSMIRSRKSAEKGKNLKVKKKPNDTVEESSEENKDVSLIQAYKDTKLVKKHLNSTFDQGNDNSSMTVNPSDGVAIIPDVRTQEKVQGKPYKEELRKFQNEFMENRGQRHKAQVEEENLEMAKNKEIDSHNPNGNNNSFDLTSDHLAQEDGIIKEELRSKPSTRSNSVRNSNKSTFNSRVDTNRSQLQTLKKEFSSISSNLNALNLKQKLMNYEVNSSVNTHFVGGNTPAKTSLILPPLTIGNMQKTIDNRTSKNQSMKKNKITFRSIGDDFGNSGSKTRRSKVSIKSSIKERILNMSGPRSKITKIEASEDQGNQTLPDISLASARTNQLPKMPSRIRKNSSSIKMSIKNLPLTKKTKNQIKFLKSLEKSQTLVKPKLRNSLKNYV